VRHCRICGKKAGRSVIIEGLRKLEYRATTQPESQFLANGEGLQIRRAKASCAIWKNHPPQAARWHLGIDTPLGHARPPTEENGHPHRDCTGKSWSCTTALSKTTSRSRRN